MCCTRLAGNTERKNDAKNRHLRTIAQICPAVSSQLRHVKQQYVLHNMANFGLLTTEIGSGVWGTPANFIGFRVLPSLLQRRRSPEANQTLHDVWPSPGLVHYTFGGGALAPHIILPGAKFTIRSCLAFAYTGSVTARHSSSGRQPNFAALYKEWNYGTFAKGATYIRQGGHHVGHRSTF